MIGAELPQRAVTPAQGLAMARHRRAAPSRRNGQPENPPQRALVGRRQRVALLGAAHAAVARRSGHRPESRRPRDRPASGTPRTTSRTVGARVTSEPLPSLVGNAAPPGGTLTATVRDPVGEGAIVLFSLTGPPVNLPGVADPFWLDPVLVVYAAFGIAPVTAALGVPASSQLLGFGLGWQAVTVDAATGELRVSNPAIGLVR